MKTLNTFKFTNKINKRFRLLLFFTGILCAFNTYAAAPSNDECVDAITLELHDNLATAQYLNGTTIDATRSAQPIRFSFNDDDVWFKFSTGPEGAPNGISALTIFDDKTGGGYAFYDSCDGEILGTSSLNICEDAFPINEALLPNHTYYLRIWSAFTGADFQGNFKIVVYKNTTKRRVSNDGCFNAKTLSVGNGACVEKVLWKTEGATDSRFDYQPAPYPSSDPDLMYQGRDVWYKFKMPASGNLVINGQLGDFSCPYNIVMNFYSGGCGSFTDRGWATYFAAFSHTLSTADFAPGEEIWMRTWLPYGRTHDYALYLCLTTACNSADNTDSDYDGIQDCYDDCPNDAFRSALVDCDCDIATIRQIRVTNQTACNGAGTSASFDDYFKADITFVFDRVPTAGSQINLRGDFRRNIVIPAGHNEITYTLKNAQLKANGKAIALGAYYNGNSSCEYATANAGVAPSPCSDVIAAETISKADAQCADVYLAVAAVNRCFDRGTVFPQDDFYEADVMVNFTTIPSSGHLNIFIDGKDYSIPVSNLSGNSYALDNIRISARQETINTSVGFSATSSCSTNQTLAPLSLSGNSVCRKCNIINVTVLGLTCTADGIDLSLVVSGGVTADSYTLKSGGATYQGVYGSNTSFSLQAGEIIDIIDNDDSTCRYRFDIEDIVCQSAGRLLSDASATPWQYSLQLGIAEGGVEMANVIDNNLPAPLHFGKGEIYNSNHSQTLKLNFYPNPTTDLVLVTLPVEEMTTESATILVYDILGQLVMEQKVIPGNSQYSIKTIDFTSGVYQIVLQNGTKKWLGKLVKE